MIKKSFSALLCGLMLVQGVGYPVLANEEPEVMEEMEFSDQISLPFNSFNDLTSVEDIYKLNLKMKVHTALKASNDSWKTTEIPIDSNLKLSRILKDEDSYGGTHWTTSLESLEEELGLLPKGYVTYSQTDVPEDPKNYKFSTTLLSIYKSPEYIEGEKVINPSITCNLPELWGVKDIDFSEVANVKVKFKSNSGEEYSISLKENSYIPVELSGEGNKEPDTYRINLNLEAYEEDLEQLTEKKVKFEELTGIVGYLQKNHYQIILKKDSSGEWKYERTFKENSIPFINSGINSTNEIIHSGKIGTANWTIDNNGLLTIGEGEYQSSENSIQDPAFAYWLEFRDEIKQVDGTAKFIIKGSCPLIGYCENLVSIDLSGWDTSQVTEMQCTFQNNTALESIVFGESWDTSSVTAMNGMFAGCSKLKSLDVSSWDTSKVKTTFIMFAGCKNLETLDVSKWDTSSLEISYQMFSGCSKLKTLDVSKWNTSSILLPYAMFGGCSSLKTLDVSKWNTSSMTDLYGMFEGCSNLESLNLANWDVSNMTTLGAMFEGCINLKELDLSNWNPRVAFEPTPMFKDCNNLSIVKYSYLIKGNDEIDIISQLPNAYKWYQNDKGPYAVSKIPALSEGEKATLTRADKVNSNNSSSSTSNNSTGTSSTNKPSTSGNNSSKPKPSTPVGGSTTAPTTPAQPQQSAKPSVKKKPSYRFFNKLTGEHFFTADEAERDQLLADNNWSNEGQGWTTPEVSDFPIYRLCNPNTGEHHYTMDKNEYDTLQTLGWKGEGVSLYSADAKDSDAVQLHRLYNPNAKDAGSHHYTVDENEKDTLVAQGWKYEGIAWHGLKSE